MYSVLMTIGGLALTIISGFVGFAYINGPLKDYIQEREWTMFGLFFILFLFLVALFIGGIGLTYVGITAK